MLNYASTRTKSSVVLALSMMISMGLMSEKDF